MLVEEYRGEILENIHDGRICVVDRQGRILGGVGDVHAMTYYRSAAKPFQLLPLFMRGIDKKYNLTDAEMTVCAASHLGEDFHMAALESILEKTGIEEASMIMLPTLPGNKEARERAIRENIPPRKLFHNCAGKHIALMLLERELTGSVDNYWRKESAAQQEVLSIIAEVSDYPKQEIISGVDGCGVPVFALPLRSIAHAYARLAATSEVRNESLRSALVAMSECIRQYPYMLRGHGQLCGEINTFSNIVSKDGAEGVYGLGLKNEGIGIAWKVADGSAHTWPLILAEILRQLRYEDEAVFDCLSKLKNQSKVNDNNEIIGNYRTVFKLFP